MSAVSEGAPHRERVAVVTGAQSGQNRIPMGRLGSPDEVASVVEFLLSDRARYVTGQLVQPNGGQMMW